MDVEELYNQFINGGNSSKIMENHNKNIKELQISENVVVDHKNYYYFVFKNNPMIIDKCWESNDNYYTDYKLHYCKLDTSKITIIHDKNLIPTYELLKDMIANSYFLLKSSESNIENLIKNYQQLKLNELNDFDISVLIEFYIVKKRHNNSYPNITLQQLISKIQEYQKDFIKE